MRPNRDDVSLKALLETLNNCQKLTAAQESKYSAMYAMAKDTRLGRIVELGTYHGLGAISLSFGSRSSMSAYVHTVDWYQPCVGVDGEEYSKKDWDVFRRYQEIANISSIASHVATFRKIASEWSYPIGLLVWDGNIFRPTEDICDWERFILPGGRIAFYDRENLLTGKEFIEPYVKSGWYKWDESYKGFITIKRLGAGVDK